MKIIGIKTNDGYYITDDINNNNYSGTYLGGYIVNGEQPKPTFNKKWVKVSEEPTKIQRWKSMPNINERYELRDPSLADKFKQTYLKSEVKLGYDDDLEEVIYLDEFKGIQSLYEFKSDPQEKVLEDVEFEYETISEIDEITEPTKFSYAVVKNFSRYAPNVTNDNAKTEMIAQIITPDLLLHTQPCRLTAQESYDVVRAYIKNNINPMVAEITSDYDFCFTVKKKIALAKEHVYQVEINNSIFNKRKKKPNYQTRVQKTYSIEIFNMAPKPYQSYKLIQPFVGDNQDDLKETIDNFLSHIIGVINEPLKECECCNGTGVIFNKNIEK